MQFKPFEILTVHFDVNLGGTPAAYTNSIGIEFVLIPAGPFQMGSEKGLDNENPVHTVTISESFYLGKYAVLQAEWEVVMGNNSSRFKGADRPVERVSWNNAQKFIQALNEKEGGAASYRLPTEAEWEYACRAGTTTEYSFGDSVDRIDCYAWYKENSGTETHPVGQRKANPWRLYDMHGNVLEWVEDWYGEYPSGAVTDPKGPNFDQHRVLRGGSFFNDRFSCRCAFRTFLYPGGRHFDFGFRVVVLPSR